MSQKRRLITGDETLDLLNIVRTGKRKEAGNISLFFKSAAEAQLGVSLYVLFYFFYNFVAHQSQLYPQTACIL